MSVSTEPVGVMVRRWRERRQRSQLDVSIAADLSTRHLSYIETGRSQPSRMMIKRLCDELDIPLRERNDVYLAAGYAPAHPERPLDDLGAAHAAVEAILAATEPCPAMAVNVRWDLLAANDSATAFLDGVADHLMGSPLNVLRATLHPDGLASRIRNYRQWRTHVLRRVRRQWERTASPGLQDLLAELQSYPVPPSGEVVIETTDQDLIMPMRVATDNGELNLLYTLTVFGAPRDITLDELAIETFYPADEATATMLGEAR